MLDNVSIRGKLIAAFSALLLILLALGAVSLFKLGGLNSRSADLAQNWLPSIQFASDMRYRLTRARMNETSYLAVADAGQRRDFLARAQEGRKEMGEARGMYEKLIANDEERRLYESFARAQDAEERLSRQALGLSAAGRAEEAQQLFQSESLEAFRASQSELQAIIDFNRKGGETAAEEASATFDRGRALIIVGMVAAIGLVGVMLALLVRKIAKPIAEVTDAMGRMSRGDMNAQVSIEGRSDEVGMLAATMKGFRDQLIAAEDARRMEADKAARVKAEQTALIVDSVGAGLAALSGGDLTHRITAELDGAFAKLKADFNRMAQQLEDAISGALHSVDTIRGGSGEIAQAADDLSRRTESQAASLEETSAALEQANSTVRATAENAKRASTRVELARNAARDGGEVADRAIAAMAEVQSSSRRIADVLTLIENISLQTNLLALNAGVEAARAGDAGRGFAVVANEVRALAQRSSEAAQEIKSIIAESTTHVDGGVDLVNRSGASLKRIADEVNGMSELFASVAQASEQQASGLAQINIAIGEMNTATQQNAAMVEETTAASRSLATEAENLAKTTGFFKVARTAGPAERPVRRAGAHGRLVAVGGRGMAAANQDDDWTSF